MSLESDLIRAAFGSEPGARRFWSKVRKDDGPDACWIWTAAKAGKGYGAICVGSKPGGTHRMVYAHRVSLILANPGLTLEGRLARHGCPTGDNPSCVNDAHLCEGDYADNMRDASERGRTCRGRTMPAEFIRRGERHHFASLTENQVREMRRRYAAGGISQSQLGREFGISSQGSVSAILRGKKWSHIS